MIAKKTYTPESYEVGELVLDQSYYAMIPAELIVKNGNGGNWTSVIKFDNLTCVYKAGSSMTNPLYTGNHNENVKGQVYNFQNCVDSSLVAGDKVYLSDKIELAVVHGDSQSMTDVKVSLFVE